MGSSIKLDSAGEGDVPLSDRREAVNTDTSGSNREIPVNCPKRIREDFSKNVTRLIVQLKCLCTDACNVGNKQEELVSMVQLENYDLIAITETWWEESHNRNTAAEGYKLFRREAGREGWRCCHLC